MFIGQAAPKQISMIASNTLILLFLSPYLYNLRCQMYIFLVYASKVKTGAADGGKEGKLFGVGHIFGKKAGNCRNLCYNILIIIGEIIVKPGGFTSDREEPSTGWTEDFRD